MKVFGKELFERKKKPVWETHLYDFFQHGGGSADGYSVDGYVRYVSVEDSIAGFTEKATATKKKKVPKTITPKELYNLDTISDKLFQIKLDPDYIKKEQALLKKKGKLMLGDSGGNHYGRIELESMSERLQNRLRLEEFLDVVEEYPHTSTEKINSVVKAHDNLVFRSASEFVPDFPEEAIDAMEKYKEMCQSLCGKDPIFYVIADRKDFGEKDKRRDPILLAQSPFGFFWQILGAWDEEMVFLGDL